MTHCAKCIYARYPKIPAPAPFQADIAIVGEAPGATEIARKACFIGPSGQLLNKVMESAHFPSRDKIYITNALLCKPPQNKPRIRQAIMTCRDRLFKELEVVKPKLIIALGNIAMHSLTGNFDLKITKEQGRVMAGPFGINMVPILHPAAVLRAPGDYKLFYTAMSYAGRLARGGEQLCAGDTQWEVMDTSKLVQEVIDYLTANRHDIGLVGCDIETTSLDCRAGDILVVAIAYDKNKAFVIPEELLRRELFTIPDIQWGWHNGKFDTSFLRRRGLPAIVHQDSMLLSYSLNEQGGVHDLEQLSSRLLGAAPYKHIANKQARDKSKKGFANLPLDVLYERVATDADYTRQCIQKMLPQIETNKELNRLYRELLLPASAFLRRVERNGIYVHLPLLQELKAEYQQHQEELMDKIIDRAMPLWDPELYKKQTGARTAPDVFNPGSTYQLAWLLFERLGLKPPIRGKGQSTNKKVLQKMQGQHPIIDEILEYRSVAKELSTYIIGLEERISKDGRAHTTYKLHGTVTGRLSSSQPNVQNQPKRKPRVRNVFQAPPGKWLLEADYRGAELRVLAEVSKDKFLTECFMQGRDLHAEVAKALNITRIRAKAVNFGIPYGRTEYSLSEELEVSVEEARRYIHDWFARAPEAAEFLNWCAEAPMEGRTLITPLGRHRRFGLVTAENLRELQREARNFIIQSTASDFTLISAMRAERSLMPLDAKIINLVHDSILVELPQDMDVVREVVKILEGVMRQTPIDIVQAKVPFEAEFKYGTEWGNLEEVV